MNIEKLVWKMKVIDLPLDKKEELLAQYLEAKQEKYWWDSVCEQEIDNEKE